MKRKLKEWIKEGFIGVIIMAMFMLSLLGGQIIRLSNEKKKAYQVSYSNRIVDGKIYRAPLETSSMEKVDMEILQVSEEPSGVEVPSYIIKITEDVGSSYDISPEFLQAVIWRESRFNEKAVNKSGTCFGLMQISIKWHSHRMENGENILDPEVNIRIGAEYLSELFNKYKDPALVLMIYQGNSRAFENGYISGYAQDILDVAEELEGNK